MRWGPATGRRGASHLGGTRAFLPTQLGHCPHPAPSPRHTGSTQPPGWLLPPPQVLNPDAWGPPSLPQLLFPFPGPRLPPHASLAQGRGEDGEAAPGNSSFLGLWALHTQPSQSIPGRAAQGLEPGEQRLWISGPARGRPPHLRSKPLARLLGAVTVAGRPIVDETFPAAPRLGRVVSAVPPTLQSIRQSADPAGTQLAGGTGKPGCLCMNMCSSPGDPLPSAGGPAPTTHSQHTLCLAGRLTWGLAPRPLPPGPTPPPTAHVEPSRVACSSRLPRPGSVHTGRLPELPAGGARQVPGVTRWAQVPSSGAAGPPGEGAAPGRLAGLPGDPLHRPQVGGQEAPRRGLTFGKMVSGQGALSFPGGR